MAKNPILPLYYNDIDRATRTWTDEEFGAYMRLLIEQWDKGGLPNDYQKLTRLATSLDTNWGLLKDKFPLTDGLLKNPVMEEIREKQRKHKEKQKSNVEKRYQNSTKPPTKKLPLEDEYENDIENKDRKEGVEEREGIIYPWPTETFKSAWSKWLRYLKKQHGKEHLTFDGEQLELRDLSQLAKTESEAVSIIDNCMAKTWKHIQKHERTSNNGGGAKGFPNPHGGKNTDSARRSADRKDFDTGGG